METASVFNAFVVENVTRESKMKAIEKNLRMSLDKMDVPEGRKELTTPNLHWLKRNLFIRNKEHEDFPFALHLIVTLLVMNGENPGVVEDAKQIESTNP